MADNRLSPSEFMKTREKPPADELEVKPDLTQSPSEFMQGRPSTPSTLTAAKAKLPKPAGPDNEQSFQNWYGSWARKSGLSPNPDDPKHKYDYRAAYKSGAKPEVDPGDGQYHWPSEFKADDHPSRFIDGVDTKTGEPVEPPKLPEGESGIEAYERVTQDMTPKEFLDIKTKYPRKIVPDMPKYRGGHFLSGINLLTEANRRQLAIEGQKPKPPATWEEIKKSVGSEYEIAKKELGPEELGRLEHVIGGVGIGLSNVVAGVPEWLAIGQSAVQRTAYKYQVSLPGPDGVTRTPKEIFEQYKTPEERDLYKLGQYIRKVAEKAFPQNPEFRDSFTMSVLPQGAGSLGGFYALAGAGAAAGAPVWAGPLLAGMSVEGSSLYLEAVKSGATPDEAFGAWVGGSLAGTTEAVPIGWAFHRINKITGGGIKKMLINGFVGGAEEMIQELVQGIGGNITAQMTFDQNRAWNDSLIEAGGAGGILGLVANVLGTALKFRRLKVAGFATEKEYDDMNAKVRDLQKAYEKATPEELEEVARIYQEAQENGVPAVSIPEGKEGEVELGLTTEKKKAADKEKKELAVEGMPTLPEPKDLTEADIIPQVDVDKAPKDAKEGPAQDKKVSVEKAKEEIDKHLEETGQKEPDIDRIREKAGAGELTEEEAAQIDEAIKAEEAPVAEAPVAEEAPTEEEAPVWEPGQPLPGEPTPQGETPLIEQAGNILSQADEMEPGEALRVLNNVATDLNDEIMRDNATEEMKDAFDAIDAKLEELSDQVSQQKVEEVAQVDEVADQDLLEVDTPPVAEPTAEQGVDVKAKEVPKRPKGAGYVLYYPGSAPGEIRWLKRGIAELQTKRDMEIIEGYGPDWKVEQPHFVTEAPTTDTAPVTEPVKRPPGTERLLKKNKRLREAVEFWENSKRIVSVYPRKKQVSINGGPPVSFKKFFEVVESVKKQKEQEGLIAPPSEVIPEPAQEDPKTDIEPGMEIDYNGRIGTVVEVRFGTRAIVKFSPQVVEGKKMGKAKLNLSISKVKRIGGPAEDTEGAAALKDAKTGKKFQSPVFRGEGLSFLEMYGEDNVESGRAGPVFGPAAYYALSRKGAKQWAKTEKQITEQFVTLKNPLVINSNRQWYQILNRAGVAEVMAYEPGISEWRPPTKEKYQEAKLALQNWAKGEGHDGVIIDAPWTGVDGLGTDGSITSGENIKRLREVFADSQVIVFETEAEATARVSGEKSRAKGREIKGEQAKSKKEDAPEKMKRFYISLPDGTVRWTGRVKLRRILEKGKQGKDMSQVLKEFSHEVKKFEGNPPEGSIDLASMKQPHQWQEYLDLLTGAEQESGMYKEPIPEHLEGEAMRQRHVDVFAWYDIDTIEYFMGMEGGYGFETLPNGKLKQEFSDLLMQGANGPMHFDPIYDSGGAPMAIEEMETLLKEDPRILGPNDDLESILKNRVRGGPKAEGGYRGYPTMEKRTEMADSEELARQEEASIKQREEEAERLEQEQSRHAAEQAGMNVELFEEASDVYLASIDMSTDEAVKSLLEIQRKLSDEIADGGIGLEKARDSIREQIKIREAEDVTAEDEPTGGREGGYYPKQEGLPGAASETENMERNLRDAEAKLETIRSAKPGAGALGEATIRELGKREAEVLRSISEQKIALGKKGQAGLFGEEPVGEGEQKGLFAGGKITGVMEELSPKKLREKARISERKLAVSREEQREAQEYANDNDEYVLADRAGDIIKEDAKGKKIRWSFKRRAEAVRASNRIPDSKIAAPEGKAGGFFGKKQPPTPPGTPPKPEGRNVPPQPPSQEETDDMAYQAARAAQASAEDFASGPEDLRSYPQMLRDLMTDLQTNFVSKYTPLRILQRELLLRVGIPVPTVDLASRFELLAGAEGQAKLDALKFRIDVIDPLAEHYREKGSNPEEAKLDFNTYLFSRRTADRLTVAPVLKKVGDWTVSRANASLRGLRKRVGEDTWRVLEAQAVQYQKHTNKMLMTMVDSGMLHPDDYKRIKDDSDFYAFFKVAKHYQDWDARLKKTGGTVSSEKQHLQRIRGMEEADVEIVDILGETMKKIWDVRIESETNKLNNELYSLAPLDNNAKWLKRGRADVFRIFEARPADEILEQIGLQMTASNDEMLEAQMIKVARAIELAKGFGLQFSKRRMKKALGMAKLGGIDMKGEVYLNAFTSEVIAHELAHAFDTALIDPETGEPVSKMKKVFGKMKRVTKNISSTINSKKVFREELSKIVDAGQLGGSQAYRNSAVERWAEFMNMYIHNPKMAKKLAPKWTKFFETEILPVYTRVGEMVDHLADFYQKVDELQFGKSRPNIKTKLLEYDNMGYLELAIKEAFPSSGQKLVFEKGSKIPPGFKRILLRVEGKVRALDVDEKIYTSLAGLPRGQAGMTASFMSLAGQMLKGGATVYNTTFLIKNAIFRDPTRLAILSKYGINVLKPNISDIWRFPLDYVQSLSSAFSGTFGTPDELYMGWLGSGAGYSDMARMVTPELFQEDPDRGRVGKVISSIAHFSSALEQTTKIMGFKRGLRMENFEKLPPDLQAAKLQEIASEVRKYSGSPDFWRHGLKVPRQMSLVFMFFGARVSGVSTDLARLGGKAGYQKEAWANLSVFVGLPTLAAALMNYEPEEREYYEKQNEKERHDYYMIPRGIFYIDDNGEKRQEYWRIPKDDTAKIFSSMVESFIKLAYDKDPWIMAEFVENFFEDISPISMHGDGWQERAESFVSSTNPLGKVPIEMLMNRNTFFHTDIIPRKMENWSPQDQRRSTTPELFIKAGKILGVSPLFLEHATRGYTAGLFTQFIPRKAQAGRAAWTAIQPLNMFASSAYGGDDLRLKRLIEVKEIADADLGGRFWEVEGRWLEMQHYKPTEFRRAVNMIAATDKEMAKKLIERRKKASLGWGYQDSVAMQLGVKNGARAKFIKGELDEFGDDKAAARKYLSSLVKKKIATKEVLKQVSYLKRRDKK